MTLAAESLGRRLLHTRLRDVLRFRIDGRLDWRRLVAEAELPAEVAAAITQVVRGTRLWRREKVDVARELIAHFQDGLESGLTGRELLESFGDPRTAAKLTRRAKRRCRPWTWHAWRWCCWGLAALLVLYAILWLRTWLGKPSVNVDYVAEANRRASLVAPAEAAWPVYHDALRTIYDKGRLPQDVNWKATPGMDEWPALEAYLSDRPSTLAMLRDASKLEGMGFHVRGDGCDSNIAANGACPPESSQGTPSLMTGVQLPHVQAAHGIALILRADAHRAALAGDGRTAADDVIAILRLSQHLQETTFLVTGLAAAARERLAFETIESLIASHPQLWSDEELKRLSEAVAAADLDWRWWLEGERMMFLDVVQRLYTDDGHGDGHITYEGLKLLHELIYPLIADVVVLSQEGNASRIAKGGSFSDYLAAVLNGVSVEYAAAPVVLASRRDLVEMHQRLMDQESERWSRPLWESCEERPDLNLANWSKALEIKYAPLVLLFPATQAAHRAYQISLGLRDGATVGLALERWRRDNGGWPASLQELAPKYLPQLPVDRLSGKPLHYRIVNDRPVVYSLGVDWDDDGGRPPQVEGDGNHYASPAFFDPARAVAAPENDGDWVLWGAGGGDAPAR